MKKQKKKLNTKKQRVVISIAMCVLVILAVVFVGYYRGKVQNEGEQKEELYKDVQEEEEYLDYRQLSDKKYEIDYENNRIIVDKDINAISICISENPNGPEPTDKWLNLDGTHSFDIGEKDEESKVYVYYLARLVSTVSEFNASASVYVVRTEEEFREFAKKVNSGDSFAGKTVYLMEDIELSGDYVAVGKEEAPFSGTFNGNGRQIMLNFKTTDTYTGVFERTSEAILKNIETSGEINTTLSCGVGILRSGTGTISNCKNYATIISTDKTAAGIVGVFRGRIENCVNYGNISGTRNIAGIGGYLEEGCQIYNCRNNGNITGTSHFVGGICGYLKGVEYSGENTSVKYCVNTGNVYSSGQYIGGIVGSAYGSTSSTLKNKDDAYEAVMTNDVVRIENCKNTGNVESINQVVGGIAGEGNYLYVSNCENEGNITCSGGYVGGIVGMSGYQSGLRKGYFIYCKNSGQILSRGGSLVGGIAGTCFGSGTNKNTASQILYCGNTGNVLSGKPKNADCQSFGGIVGRGTNVRVMFNYNTGNVTGGRYSGGIAGSFQGDGTSGTRWNYVANCYSDATISGLSSTNQGIANFWYTKINRGNNNAQGSYTTVYKRYSSEGEQKEQSSSKQTNISSYTNFYRDSYEINGGKWILAMNVDARIFHHPQSYINPKTETVELETIAGGANLTYQWYKVEEKDLDLEYGVEVTQEMISAESGTLIQGATQATYEAPVTNKRVWYYCIVGGEKVTGRDANYDATSEATSIRTQAGLVGPGEFVAVAAVLMERGNEEYILGADTREENTTYTSDKLKKINICNAEVDALPIKYVATWDASLSGDSGVVAYLTTNAQDTEKYDLWLYGTGQIALPKNSKNLFANYTSLTEISGLKNISTVEVTNMNGMFKNCEVLSSVEVSRIDTKNVTDMGKMFENCKALTAIDVSGFDTSSAKNMEYMFNNCEKVTTLDVENFETKEVTNMRNMFNRCLEITSLDVSKFNTGKVTDMSNMFSNCEKVTTLDVENFETKEVTNMKEMFSGCEKITTLDLSKFITSKVTNMAGMFSGCESATTLKIDNFNTIKVTSMKEMFSGDINLTTLNVRNFRTVNVVDMSGMFSNCKKLSNINVGYFNTSKVTNMKDMFNGCEAVSKLDLYRFNTKLVLDMSGMLKNCKSIEKIDLKNFNTSKVTNAKNMFEGCSSLTGLDLSKFDYASGSRDVEKEKMFRGMTSLKSIVLGKNFGDIDGNNMFENVNQLEAIIMQKEITTSSEAASIATNTGLGDIQNVKLYVPNETSKTAYSSLTNYTNIFTTGRIKEMLEMVGNSKVTTIVSGEYVDEGHTVIDKTKEDAEEYAQYNYYLDVKDDVDVSKIDVYEVIYTLKYAE